MLADGTYGLSSSTIRGRSKIMQQKLWREDLFVGQEFLSDAHTLTADEIKDFAGRYDPQPFHLDDEAAGKTMFGGLAASGWHTAAITMRLSVKSFPLASGTLRSGGGLHRRRIGSAAGCPIAGGEDFTPVPCPPRHPWSPPTTKPFSPDRPSSP